MNRKHKAVGNNIVRLMRQREIKDTINYSLQQKLHVTEDFVNRLGLETELVGHNGCVNCLEWNESGTILASASDDVQVILWDPFLHKKLHTVQTDHHGNIFSVKFLPKSNDSVLVSGAGDCRIRVHDITLNETTHVCSCHTGRVKRLAIAPNVPYMFWSAAEDGIIMQFDLRTPHSCPREVNNVLINLLNHMGRYAEAKCLAINPQRPELLAVGANDPYIRLYDRRMIKPTTIEYPPENTPRSTWERQNYLASRAGEGELEDNLPQGCVQYFVAGHLPLKQHDFRKKYRNLASTYLTFGADGNELLVNLGGEQIYLFDINNKRRPKTFDMQAFSLDTAKCKELCPGSNGYSNGFRTGTNGFSTNTNGVTRSSNGVTPRYFDSKKPPLPRRVEALKLSANDAFERQHFTLAISLYNKAISMCPSHAILYGNRAAAYMKRGWDGDVYAAMRDCHTALQLDPDHVKAHFRLARCLYELKWTQEAQMCLDVFRAKFPDHAQSHACKALSKDIQTAANSKVDVEMEPDDPEGSRGASMASDGTSSNTQPLASMSAQEHIWRDTAFDYETRFCGHCNTTTDIKEANFFGSQGQYIVAGSDDGSFFIWDRRTTNIKRVLRGDDSIVNCLQPHPSYCLLATSGIDPVVRLWSPRPDDGSKNEREVMDLDDAASANQKRMNADPFEVMLMNMGYRITSIPGEDGDAMESESRDAHAINCRPS
ncbi:WD and tetratricopeptide repeats protein 1 [Anabrus simplex]|uniref:WD and tetratricopeptide repeats protein 1 n=1 Tax=Anabrus simplex TaxID=316456 RepID=UPI0035A32F8B